MQWEKRLNLKLRSNLKICEVVRLVLATLGDSIAQQEFQRLDKQRWVDRLSRHLTIIDLNSEGQFNL